MNRIVLIGNGFDLAHGLPTKFPDFINWYFRGLLNVKRKWNADRQISVFTFGDISMEIYGLLEDIEGHIKKFRTFADFENLRKINEGSEAVKIRYNNDFLEIICKNFIQNSYQWVDIENLYFERLKRIACGAGHNESSKTQVIRLNEDVDRIEKVLLQYLQWVQDEFSDVSPIKDISEAIYSIIDPEEIAISQFKTFNEGIGANWDRYKSEVDEIFLKLVLKEKLENFGIDININYFKDYVEAEDPLTLWTTMPGNYKDYKNDIQDFFLVPDRILFLNFNYTYTDDLYHKTISEDIHIHGEINEKRKNPIILGYGDEFCDNYKELEDLGHNCYMGKIKSSRYLQTNNYRKFLNFIESDMYQVIILGHSCGNTDRTLLRTLFEHDNCLSIKPYYYIDKETGADNYSEMSMSISRIFSDKTKMRDRVVNKTICSAIKEDKV